MRVAILSDIHSNLPALNAVLEDVASMGVSEYWCLGDVVGYGPWPIQCWERLKGLELNRNTWIVGNHELGLLNHQNSYADGDAKTVLQYHRETCETSYPDIFNQIKDMLAMTYPLPHVVMAHGVPNKTVFSTVTKYPKTSLDFRRAVAAFSELGASPSIILGGHSHCASFWYSNNEEGSQWTEGAPVEGGRSFSFSSDQRVYINPGSVGQPRDGKTASYCYMDFKEKTVCFRRVSYSRKVVKDTMMKLGYPQKLMDDWY